MANEEKKKKKFSFLRALGLGTKKRKDVFHVGTAAKAIRDNKKRKQNVLDQIK